MTLQSLRYYELCHRD